MCDTMVCLPEVTKSGDMIFAKNSDRGPNEPHIIERYPAKDYDLAKNSKVKATYIEIDQVEHTYAVTLFKPSWIWGAEMGFNEHGVNIGNEAVFTKGKRGQDALLGMDLLRLSLERSKTAYEAMLTITDLLAKYGQGGNCGYQKKFYYDNSYLIADGKEAYVLETAKDVWAAKKVKDIYAISNGLTIEGDFDYAHPIVQAEKDSKPNYSFARKYKEPVFTFFAESKGRRCCAEQMLREKSGKITIETLTNVLRSHREDKCDVASVGSICMHAGGLIGDHTTGSYIVEYNKNNIVYYATGASLPCLSMYKPILQEKVNGDCTEKGVKYWYDREMLNRYFLAGQADRKGFLAKRDSLEQEMFKGIAKAKELKDLIKIVKDITTKEEKLIKEYLNPLQDKKHEFKLGKSSYRKFWSKKTEKLIKDLN